jgi:hypothetical protein
LKTRGKTLSDVSAYRPARATSPGRSSRYQPRPATSPLPRLPGQVRAAGNQSTAAYGPRQAAYDPKKLRGKLIVKRLSAPRRYAAIPSGPRAITALLGLRDNAIKPSRRADAVMVEVAGGGSGEHHTLPEPFS